MLSHDQLLLFAAATAALAFSPGPNQAYMLSRTLAKGRRAGMMCLLGVESGFFVHLFAAAFGLTAFFLAVPLAYSTLRLVGAAYLFYLAWQTIRGTGAFADLNRQVPDDPPQCLFRMGFLSNTLNPKTAVFYFSIFPQFVDPALGSVFGQSIILGLVHIIVSTSCNLAIILAAGYIASGLRRGTVWEGVRRWLFGGLLAGFAVHLALESRK
jgi:threonine/homoserine/homoserine lactone efflux protein